MMLKKVVLVLVNVIQKLSEEDVEKLILMLKSLLMKLKFYYIFNLVETLSKFK